MTDFIVRDAGLCGGAPNVAGTRLVVSDVVTFVRDDGAQRFLQVWPHVSAGQMGEAIRYCAARACSGGDVFCRGCVLDSKYDKEPPEELWLQALAIEEAR